MKYWQRVSNGELATSSNTVDLSPEFRQIEKSEFDVLSKTYQSAVCSLGGLHIWVTSDYVENYSWCEKCGTKRSK